MSLSSAIQSELRAGEWRTTGGARPHDGRDPVASDGAEDFNAGVDGVRLRGVVAGRSRDLRTDGVFGGAARPGNRHPARSGSGIQPDPKYGRVARPATRSGRYGVRAGCRSRVDRFDLQISVWCDGVGPGSLLCGSPGTFRRRARCRSVAGNARKSSRSRPCAAVRIASGRQEMMSQSSA